MTTEERNQNLMSAANRLMNKTNDVVHHAIWLTNEDIRNLTETTFDKMITELEALQRVIEQ